MKPSVHAANMKWTLAVAVLLVTGVLFLIARKEVPQREPRSAADVAAEAEIPAAGPGLTLSAGVTDERSAKPGDTTSLPAAQASAEDADETTSPRPGGVPHRAPTLTPEGERKAEPATYGRLSDGRIVLTEPLPKPLTKEESEAAAKKTRDTLEAANPLRATWNDVPLQDMLRQLSQETGMVLALGPRALLRGVKIRVSDPLADADPAVAPTVWSILTALARQHDFVLGPWKKGVLLCEREDPAEVRMRYYDVRDLLRAEVGGGKMIAAEDRLPAVLPSLLREAAGLEQNGAVELHGGTIIARQSNSSLERVGMALNTWRADPKQFQQDYMTLLSKRHPTVSGAPPRKDSKGESADEEGEPGSSGDEKK